MTPTPLLHIGAEHYIAIDTIAKLNVISNGYSSGSTLVRVYIETKRGEKYNASINQSQLAYLTRL